MEFVWDLVVEWDCRGSFFSRDRWGPVVFIS
jgi:hypothetical protein